MLELFLCNSFKIKKKINLKNQIMYKIRIKWIIKCVFFVELKVF